MWRSNKYFYFLQLLITLNFSLSLSKTEGRNFRFCFQWLAGCPHVSSSWSEKTTLQQAGRFTRPWLSLSICFTDLFIPTSSFCNSCVFIEHFNTTKPTLSFFFLFLTSIPNSLTREVLKATLQLVTLQSQIILKKLAFVQHRHPLPPWDSGTPSTITSPLSSVTLAFSSHGSVYFLSLIKTFNFF